MAQGVMKKHIYFTGEYSAKGMVDTQVVADEIGVVLDWGDTNTVIRMDVENNKLRLRCINGVLIIKPVAHNAIEIEVE